MSLMTLLLSQFEIFIQLVFSGNTLNQYDIMMHKNSQLWSFHSKRYSCLHPGEALFVDVHKDL